VHEKRKDHAWSHCAAAFSEASNLTKHVCAVHEKRRDHVRRPRADGLGRLSWLIGAGLLGFNI
jgi:hypothetical protein